MWNLEVRVLIPRILISVCRTKGVSSVVHESVYLTRVRERINIVKTSMA